MATHKVPQDVEAEDKLVAFLSLKQFILTVLGLGFSYLTFFFFVRVHPITSIIWMPFALVCLVLGLYQRKDQPVEVFLASAIRYFLKPRTRLWNQEGYEERVIITAPPKVEHHYTKGFSSDEATSRLGNLSRLMDSRGWTTKLVADFQNPQLATAASSDRLVQPSDIGAVRGIDPQAYVQPADVMDEDSSVVAKEFQSRIDQTDSSAKQHALQVLQQAQATSSDDAATATNSNTPTPADETVQAAPTYRQYPTMHQKVVQPVKAQDPAPASAAPSPPSPSQNKDLDEEVEISLH